MDVGGSTWQIGQYCSYRLAFGAGCFHSLGLVEAEKVYDLTVLTYVTAACGLFLTVYGLGRRLAAVLGLLVVIWAVRLSGFFSCVFIVREKMDALMTLSRANLIFGGVVAAGAWVFFAAFPCLW